MTHFQQKNTHYEFSQKAIPFCHLFYTDILNFLEKKIQGHMEKWEYGHSCFEGDLAGGATFWNELVNNPYQYYPVEVEYKLIKKFLSLTKTAASLLPIKSVVELGPGNICAIQHKTIPFIKKCTNTSAYIAIDIEEEQAREAVAHIVKNAGKNLKARAIIQDFNSYPLRPIRLEPTAFIMWGCTFGNIPSIRKENILPFICKKILHISQTLAAGDILFLTFDTEDREKVILRAYNQPLLSKCFLSPLHRLTRDGYVSGDFDPHLWRHESIWIPESRQCAHTIYPTRDQNFLLGNHEFKIAKGERFVTNNSYKIKPDTMIAAAESIGLSTEVVQHGSMAILVARKK